MPLLQRLFTPNRASLQKPCATETAPGPSPTLPEGFTSIEEFDPRDVFVVGYPKSGNTWMQNLVAALLYGLIPEYAPPKLAQLDLVPDVHYRKFYRRYSTPMCFKSHHLPRPDYRRVVYLVRDGRDAMVSYYHFLKAQQHELGFLELVKSGRGLFPCKWHEHVEQWLANPFEAEMLVLSYEGLQADPVRELQRLCAFIELPREKAFLEMMARSACFENLHQREVKLGRAGNNPRWLPGKFFFRRGVVGSYRDEMPAPVQEAFLAEAEETLRRMGYVE